MICDKCQQEQATEEYRITVGDKPLPTKFRLCPTCADRMVRAIGKQGTVSINAKVLK